MFRKIQKENGSSLGRGYREKEKKELIVFKSKEGLIALKLQLFLYE